MMQAYGSTAWISDHAVHVCFKKLRGLNEKNIFQTSIIPAHKRVSAYINYTFS